MVGVKIKAIIKGILINHANVATVGRLLVAVAGYMGNIPLMLAFTALAAIPSTCLCLVSQLYSEHDAITAFISPCHGP